MPICLLTDCGWFYAAKAELSSCYRDLISHKAENIIYMVFYRKCVLAFGPKE